MFSQNSPCLTPFLDGISIWLQYQKGLSCLFGASPCWLRDHYHCLLNLSPSHGASWRDLGIIPGKEADEEKSGLISPHTSQSVVRLDFSHKLCLCRPRSLCLANVLCSVSAFFITAADGPRQLIHHAFEWSPRGIREAVHLSALLIIINFSGSSSGICFTAVIPVKVIYLWGIMAK